VFSELIVSAAGGLAATETSTLYYDMVYSPPQESICKALLPNPAPAFMARLWTGGGRIIGTTRRP